ncbi:MAG: flagellar protein FlaG [Helicobacteraceae bacterium]
MEVNGTRDVSGQSASFKTQGGETAGAKREQNMLEQTKGGDYSKEELSSMVSQMNKSLKPLSTKVKFDFDGELGEYFINVVNSSSGELIRRIPSKEAARIAHNMKELVGIIFDEKI